jgi:hypothetical protein
MAIGERQRIKKNKILKLSNQSSKIIHMTLNWNYIPQSRGPDMSN